MSSEEKIFSHDSHELFLDSSPAWKSFRQRIENVIEILQENYTHNHRPFSGKTPEQLESILRDLTVHGLFPEEGIGMEKVIEEVGQYILPHQVNLHHPNVMAHLHCPPLQSSILSEVIIGATNQSMDSWDQAPMATHLEELVIKALCQEIGYTPGGDGVFTSGGTQSNLMGLLLARDHYAWTKLQWSIAHEGLPRESRRWKVLCLEHAHFSVGKSLHLLGLGSSQLLLIPEDKKTKSMPVSQVEKTLKELRRSGDIPLAVVTTIGTTDFGSIDDLQALGELCQAEGVWLHGDAAYGGGLLFSEKHRPLIKGIEGCDSLAIDFHKMLYQSVSCGSFFVKDSKVWDYIKTSNPYLNRAEDEEKGIPNLVNKSLQTTRRFDAFKVFFSLRSLGKNSFATMIDQTIQLTEEVEKIFQEIPSFELVFRGPLNSLTFRFKGKDYGVGVEREEMELILDEVNQLLREDFFLSGKAVIGQTSYQKKVVLKFTILNPHIRPKDLRDLLLKLAVKGEKTLSRLLERKYEHQKELEEQKERERKEKIEQESAQVKGRNQQHALIFNFHPFVSERYLS